MVPTHEAVLLEKVLPGDDVVVGEQEVSVLAHDLFRDGWMLAVDGVGEITEDRKSDKKGQDR